MTDHVLVGGGGFANELFDWFAGPLEAAGGRIVGYLQDDAFASDTSPGLAARLPRLGPIQSEAAGGRRLIMAVSAPAAKLALAERFADRGAFATLRHPSAVVSASASLGAGVVLAPFSLVSASAVVGDLVTVNAHSSVGHDVTVGEGTTLSSYVDLTGYVTVGPQSFWGSGARVLPRVRVGARTTIGAGAVVFRTVPDGATLFAAPARKLS